MKAWSCWQLFCYHERGAYLRSEPIQRTAELKEGESRSDGIIRAVPEAKLSLNFFNNKVSALLFLKFDLGFLSIANERDLMESNPRSFISSDFRPCSKHPWILDVIISCSCATSKVINTNLSLSDYSLLSFYVTCSTIYTSMIL